MEPTARPTPEDLLRTLGPEARIVRHAVLGRPIRTAHDLAGALGCAPERVAKTLFLCAASPATPYAAVLLAAPDRADFATVARALGTKSTTLATPKELQQVLGTVPGAVSPLCLADAPLYMDETLLGLPTIFVSGGQLGVDIEVPPSTLAATASARTGRFSRSSGT